MKYFIIGLLTLTFFSIAACCCVGGSKNPETKPLQVAVLQLKAGPQDNRNAAEPMALWITDSQALAGLYRQIHSNILGVDMNPPQIDLTKEGVLYLSMGMKTSAGYQIALADNNAVIENDVATIRVNWLEPEPGAITAQVLTSPYLLLRLPRLELKRIRTLDQNMLIKTENRIK